MSEGSELKQDINIPKEENSQLSISINNDKKTQENNWELPSSSMKTSGHVDGPFTISKTGSNQSGTEVSPPRPAFSFEGRETSPAFTFRSGQMNAPGTMFGTSSANGNNISNALATGVFPFGLSTSPNTCNNASNLRGRDIRHARPSTSGVNIRNDTFDNTTMFCNTGVTIKPTDIIPSSGDTSTNQRTVIENLQYKFQNLFDNTDITYLTFASTIKTLPLSLQCKINKQISEKILKEKLRYTSQINLPPSVTITRTKIPKNDTSNVDPNNGNDPQKGNNNDPHTSNETQIGNKNGPNNGNDPQKGNKNDPKNSNEAEKGNINDPPNGNGPQKENKNDPPTSNETQKGNKNDSNNGKDPQKGNKNDPHHGNDHKKGKKNALNRLPHVTIKPVETKMTNTENNKITSSGVHFVLPDSFNLLALTISEKKLYNDNSQNEVTSTSDLADYVRENSVSTEDNLT